MQEQAPYKKTPEQGWSQMKTVLDQEMPVDKRSRRMILFWWSLAGVTLMGLAGVFALRSDFISAKSNTSSPVQQLTPNQNNPTDEIKTEEHPAVTKNEFALNEPNKESITSIRNESNRAATSKKSISSSAVEKNDNQTTTITNKAISKSTDSPMALNQNVNSQSSSTPTESKEEATSSLAENLISNIEIVEPYVTVQRNNSIAGPVPPLDMEYFTIPENELGHLQASEFTKINKHALAINPSVEANVLSGFNGGTGWYAGAGADVKLSSTFSLTAGLGYRSYSPGANLFSSAKGDLAFDPSSNGLVKNDTVFDGFYVAGESINNATYQDLDPVIESLHQGQAQVGVDWKFSKRFSLESGLGLAFLTQAYSEYPIVPLSYASSAVNTKVSNSLEGYDVIRKTMASCFAGVSYHIGRHVAVKLQWFHTFQPYLNTDGNTGSFVSFKQRDDFIRGITLGMKYSFM